MCIGHSGFKFFERMVMLITLNGSIVLNISVVYICVEEREKKRLSTIHSGLYHGETTSLMNFRNMIKIKETESMAK